MSRHNAKKDATSPKTSPKSKAAAKRRKRRSRDDDDDESDGSGTKHLARGPPPERFAYKSVAPCFSPSCRAFFQRDRFFLSQRRQWTRWTRQTEPLSWPWRRGSKTGWSSQTRFRSGKGTVDKQAVFPQSCGGDEQAGFVSVRR